MIRNQEVNWKFQFDEETYALSPEMTLGLDTREITIGQVLRGAGYSTHLVGKWDSGRARRFLPLQRGFDSFYGFANTGVDYYTHERYGVPSLFRSNDRIKEDGHLTDLFRREALRVIDEHGDRPFFLYLAFNAPHIASTFDKSARQVPEKYLRMYAPEGARYTRKLEYPALCTQMDDSIGMIMDRLKQRALDDNTLVVFISDNGGDAAANNGPLRGGKTQLFEGGLRVPMIARWPGRTPEQSEPGFRHHYGLFPDISRRGRSHAAIRDQAGRLQSLAGVGRPRTFAAQGVLLSGQVRQGSSRRRMEMGRVEAGRGTVQPRR
jgi:arylsulfatase A-like enzyme